MSEETVKRVTSKGVPLAEITDAGQALLRIISDSTIHGKPNYPIPMCARDLY
jgi:hypothetical protein